MAYTSARNQGDVCKSESYCQHGLGQKTKLGMAAHSHNPTLWKIRAAAGGVRVISGYIASSRPACAIWEPSSKNQNRHRGASQNSRDRSKRISVSFRTAKTTQTTKLPKQNQNKKALHYHEMLIVGETELSRGGYM